MKTLFLAAIRCSLMFTAVTALSIACPASVQAVATTYQYTGNHFTLADGPYTTSDFVTAMVTLAAPLAPNMPLTLVTPTAFTLTDGVQTLNNFNAEDVNIGFATDASGNITAWRVFALAIGHGEEITTHHDDPFSFPQTYDEAISGGALRSTPTARGSGPPRSRCRTLGLPYY